VTRFLPLISVSAFPVLSLFHTCFSALATSFALFRMARPISGAAGSGSEDRESGGSKERTESARLSDAGSHGEAGDMVAGSWSYLLRPSTVTISQICAMIEGRFAVLMSSSKLQSCLKLC
jgi:hypothetical protein